MHKLVYQLPYAEIEWQDGTPYSPIAGDIYWNRADGSAEKQHVFIEANNLAERWQQLKPGQHFTIVETGFGFGLSFMLTLKHWRKHAPPGCQLHYVAFENTPVSPKDLQQLKLTLPDLPMQELQDRYPDPTPGAHYRWFTGNVCLSLCLGDIRYTLPDTSIQADACYLDGFSPGQGGEIWSTEVIRKLADQLRPGATLSSYSVAGSVRRTLQDAGLSTSRQPGFGRKKHCLLAVKSGAWQAKQSTIKRVGIIGAGATGLFCAVALNRRGIETLVFEQADGPLGAVRQIPQVGIYPQLFATPQYGSLLSLRSFGFFEQHHDFNRSGRLELIHGHKTLERAEKISRQLNSATLLDQVSCSNLSGVAVNAAGLFLANAGWTEPGTLFGDVNLIRHTSMQANELLTGSNAVDAVILATGATPQLLLAPLNLLPVRGQCLVMPACTSAPKTIVAGAVTWFPGNKAGTSTLAATFDRGNSQLEASTADSMNLVNSLEDMTGITASNFEPCVGIRTTTRDRLPVVSKIPNWQRLTKRSAESTLESAQENYPHHYCAVGFGSHGFTLGPMLTELLARQLNDEPMAERLDMLSAARFILRDQKGKSGYEDQHTS